MSRDPLRADASYLGQLDERLLVDQGALVGTGSRYRRDEVQE